MTRFLAIAFRSTLAALLAAVSLAASAAVDVNRASEPELQSIKGVGQGMATRIVAARQQAAFKDWTDLVTRVPGLGAKKAAKVSQAGLTVGGSAFDPASYTGMKGTKAGKAARSGKAPKAPKGTRSTRAPRAAKGQAGMGFGAFGATQETIAP